ncbi:hypothetical protein MHU86_13551 [Fragilaria crotonensis]|nr:hypothetical protein MHU86_13551 [Fragilaria crotonensis]
MTIFTDQCAVACWFKLIFKDVKEVFQALWRAINQQHTKSNLMYHIGQLERAMDGGFINMIGDELAIIELILDRAVVPPPLRLTVVPPFMAILHAGPIHIIRDVKAIGKEMSRNSNVDMLTGSDSSMDYSSTVTKSSRSDASNVTMDEV